MATLRERVAQKKREAMDRATTVPSSLPAGHSSIGAELELWAVQSLPGRGLGCIALSDIAIGTRVLAEPPLTVEGPGLPTIESAVEALNPADRMHFFALAQEVRLYGETKSIAGIIGTNGIPFEVDGEDFGGIFPRASRFNHSCDANAIYLYNTALGLLTVHAAKTISAGDEITFNYLPPFTESLPLGGAISARGLRQQRLRSAFGFECSCAWCSLTGEDLARSEERIRAIGDDASLVATWTQRLQSSKSAQPAIGMVGDGAEALLQHLETRYRLAQEEYPEGHFCGVDRMLRLHVELCDAAASRHHRVSHESNPFAEAARMWALVARDATVEIAGRDSPAHRAWTMVLEQDCWRRSGPDSPPSFALVWTTACKDGAPRQAWMAPSSGGDDPR